LYFWLLILLKVFGKINAMCSAPSLIACLINFFAKKLLLPKGGLPINKISFHSSCFFKDKKSCSIMPAAFGSISKAMQFLNFCEKSPQPAEGSIIV
jgi:hypothetical protein